MPPTTYRPPQRPVAATPKKNPLLIVVIAAGALAVIGLVLAGILWSGKSAAQATVLQHQDAAAALAKGLGVTLSADTNKPVDWTAAWAALDKAVTEQKTALADAKTQSATLEQQVTELQTSVTELGDVKTKADQQATQLKQRTEELAALKTSSAEQVATLEKELADTKQALADAQAAADAAAAAAAAQAAANPAEAAPAEGTPAVEGAAPAATPAEAPAAAAVAEGATPATDEEMAALEPVAKDGTHVFPEGTTKVITKISYDAEGKILKVRLADDNQLVYRTVPYELFDSLINAPVPDVYFRLKLVGNFPCTPDDKEALRALNKR